MLKLLCRFIYVNFFTFSFGGGGGGGGQNTTTGTTYTQSLSPELVPYATDIAQRAQT